MGTTAAHTAAHTRPSSRRTVLSSAPHDRQVKSRFSVDQVTEQPRRSSRHLSILDSVTGLVTVVTIIALGVGLVTSLMPGPADPD